MMKQYFNVIICVFIYILLCNVFNRGKFVIAIGALFCLFVLLLFVLVSSYGHCWTVSSPNHTFTLASLNKQLPVLRAHTFACY